MPPATNESFNSSGRRRSALLNESLTKNKKNHLYEVLELTKDASEEDIKRTYRRLALRYHPDKNQNDPESGKRFQEINYANSILSNPTKKRIYDEYGEMGLKMVEQLGEERMNLVLRPWVKWVVFAVTILTCGCFGCCCCCFCCCQCCFNFCCGKCKPEGMQDAYEYAQQNDPENPIIAQPSESITANNDTLSSSATIDEVQEHTSPDRFDEPPPPYSPPTPTSPLAAPAPAKYGTATE